MQSIENQNITLGDVLNNWWTDIKDNADFYSKENQQYYVYVMENFNFKTERTIVFLPCASKKPISKSRTHCYLSPITKEDRFERIILSEPQTVIPYSLESNCPNYDYPPGQLNERDRWQLVRRLGIFLAKLHEENPIIKRVYYIGGIHHLKVLTEANLNINCPFEIISSIPKRGIRDYYSTAVEFKKTILKQEGFLSQSQHKLTQFLATK